jgi:hypothetical protein
MIVNPLACSTMSPVASRWFGSEVGTQRLNFLRKGWHGRGSELAAI